MNAIFCSLKKLPARLVLAAIAVYQRRISPHKGYGCAYRLKHGGSGCSGVGRRLIRRYGLLKGWRVLQKRFERCRAENLRRRAGGMAYHQRGDCVPDIADCAPDVLHLPETCGDSAACKSRFCSSADCALEFCNCCDVFDFGRSKRKKRRQTAPKRKAVKRKAA